MIFDAPWVLLLVPVFLVFLVIHILRDNDPGFSFPSVFIFKRIKNTSKPLFYKKLFYLKVIAVVLIIFALARPRVLSDNAMQKEGIAIVMAIDCSSTMLAEDLKLELDDIVRLSKGKRNIKTLTRMDAVKDVAAEFISSRPDDMIGLVAFASEAFLVCPITFDHEWLLKSLDRIKIGLIKDGTAIGSGILSSLNSLKDIESKSRVIILLTDGVNNFGQISPLTAARSARALGVKIYAIGVISDGVIEYSLHGKDGMRTEKKKVLIDLDEDLLKEVANITGGIYLRASNMDELKESYRQINKMEKTKIKESSYREYSDVFYYFVIAAIFLIILDLILSNTILKKIP